MNLADLIIIILLIMFVVSGIRHGLVWELFTTLGLLLGFGLTYYFRKELLDLVIRFSDPGWQRQWVGGLAFLVFFLAIYLGFAGIGRWIHEALAKTFLKWPDTILGSAAGALKGAVLIGLLVVALDWLGGGEAMRNFIYQSKIIRWGREAVYSMVHWEPASKRQWVVMENPKSQNPKSESGIFV
jgi:uncharacterized membrane protein required for colicin V production